MRCVWLVSLLFLASCAGEQGSHESVIHPATGTSPDKLTVVDCLLPGMLIQQGQFHTWMTPRQPVRTTAQECEIGGGEYVSYDRANFATALNVWKEAADRGDAAAQTYVGEIYEKGLGIPPDPATAKIWYQKAADQGYSRALTNLAYLYEKGLGVERNPQKAMNLYRQAVGLPETFALAPKADSAELRALRQQLEEANRKLQESDAQLRRMQEQATDKEQKVKQLQDDLKTLQDKTRSDGTTLQQLRDDLSRSKEDIKRLKSQTMTADSAAELSRAQAAAADKEEKLKRQEKEFKNLQDKSAKDGARLQLLQDELNHGKEDVDRFKHEAEKAKEEAKRSREQMLELQAKQIAGVASPSRFPPGLKLGNYYALVFGNQNYKNHAVLKTSVEDAKRVAAILKDKYQFKTEVHLDADYRTMREALWQAEKRLGLTENDNLVIYYAGHGKRQEEIRRGFWLPVDASPELDETWVSTGEISDKLGISKAKHILVVVDSCYAGALVRGVEEVPTPANPNDPKAGGEWMRRMAEAKSRHALTSGGLTPVIDNDGKSKNSVFARVFLDILDSNSGEVLSGHTIWAKLTPQVVEAASRLHVPQTPEYTAMFGLGHDSGEFFFAPAKQTTAEGVGPPHVWMAGLSATVAQERHCVNVQPSLAITYFQIFRELASTIWPCRAPVAAHG